MNRFPASGRRDALATRRVSQDMVPTRPHLRTAGVVLLGGSTWVELRATDGSSLMHLVNLPIHEAGHLVLALFGDTMSILGGSLLQVIVPLAFAAYFVHAKDAFAAGIAAWWFGQNIVEVSIYMADAYVMQLPLLGGGTDGHDWNMLFDQWQVLEQTARYAGWTRGVGTLAMLLALTWCALTSRVTPTVASIEHAGEPTIVVE